ncbi:MAG: HU family DNA-binding protein [Myxococcales bacterium]|nr:HU family DNA-binding protein [Myxococcales bacterium]
MGEAIREGRFSYPGFGTFSVKERAAREGRNPKSKEKIQIAASKSVGFKPAAKLKDSL